MFQGQPAFRAKLMHTRVAFSGTYRTASKVKNGITSSFQWRTHVSENWFGLIYSSWIDLRIGGGWYIIFQRLCLSLHFREKEGKERDNNCPLERRRKQGTTQIIWVKVGKTTSWASLSLRDQREDWLWLDLCSFFLCQSMYISSRQTPYLSCFFHPSSHSTIFHWVHLR